MNAAQQELQAIEAFLVNADDEFDALVKEARQACPAERAALNDAVEAFGEKIDRNLVRAAVLRRQLAA